MSDDTPDETVITVANITAETRNRRTVIDTFGDDCDIQLTGPRRFSPDCDPMVRVHLHADDEEFDDCFTAMTAAMAPDAAWDLGVALLHHANREPWTLNEIGEGDTEVSDSE